jgi:hypothetical protein
MVIGFVTLQSIKKVHLKNTKFSSFLSQSIKTVGNLSNTKLLSFFSQRGGWFIPKFYDNQQNAKLNLDDAMMQCC